MLEPAGLTLNVGQVVQYSLLYCHIIVNF